MMKNIFKIGLNFLTNRDFRLSFWEDITDIREAKKRQADKNHSLITLEKLEKELKL